MKRAYVNVTPEQSLLLQLALFNKGHVWGDNEKTVQYIGAEQLSVGLTCLPEKIRFCSIPEKETATFAQVMEWALTNKPFWKEKQTLTFGKHTAEIMPGEYIKIGCTTLSNDKVKEIITAWNAGKIEKRWIKVCSKKESTLVQLACFREGIQWVRHYANQLFFCDDMTGTYYLCPFINGDKKELIWSDKEYQSLTFQECMECLTFQEGMECLLTGTLFNEIHYIDIPNLLSIKVHSGVSIEHPIEGSFPAELINKLIEIYQS